MRKLILMLLTLLLVPGAFPAVAATTDDLTNLARYVPASAPLYVGLRSDDAYIDTIDSVLATLGESLPQLQAVGVRMTLDQAAQNVDPDADFASLIRPWLGDTVAFAATDASIFVDGNSTASQQSLRILLSITDRDAAESFMDRLGGFGLERGEFGNVTTYAGPSSSILVYDDAVIIAPVDDPEIILEEVKSSLSAVAGFTEAFTPLPQAEYNIALYVDVSQIDAGALADAQFALNEAGMSIDLAAVLQALGPQTAGLTILEDRSLVLDVAANIADPDALAAAGMPLSPDTTPIDAGFVSNVPVGTPLLLHSAGFGSDLLLGLEQARTVGDLFDTQFENGELSFDQQSLTQIDEAVTFLELAFQGMAGASIADTFGWMTGDYALFVDVDLQSMQRIIPTLGFITAAEDSANAVATVDALENLLTELTIFNTREGDTLTLPAFGDFFADEALDVLIAADDALLSMGTRNAFSLTNGSIADTEAYATASAVFLTDMQSLAYVDAASLAELAQSAADIMGEPDLMMLAQVLGAFESASITSTYDETGSGVNRFVLTLAP